MHCFTITAKASQDRSEAASALVPVVVAVAAVVAVVVAVAAVEVVADAVGVAARREVLVNNICETLRKLQEGIFPLKLETWPKCH